ncbi:MAG: methyltransferase, partial [Deltaproteobacteria bacterium]|nr:methyltransferase [Deltaproteobacteria bacterium]
MTKRHRIQFPPADVRELCQDEVYFYLLEGDSKEKIRLHDYERIFDVPGLYEQVVYERLKCQSP